MIETPHISMKDTMYGDMYSRKRMHIHIWCNSPTTGVTDDVYNMDSDHCSSPSHSPNYSDVKQEPQEHEVSTTHKSRRLKLKVCMVCGDKALGHNFNAVTCESCKAFFRRNAFKHFKGRCEGKCDINMETRSYCKRCRLQKCFTVGMKKDLILNDEQRMHRRIKIEENRMRRTGAPLSMDSYDMLTEQTSQMMSPTQMTPPQMQFSPSSQLSSPPYLSSPTQLTSPIQLASPTQLSPPPPLPPHPPSPQTVIPLSAPVNTPLQMTDMSSISLCESPKEITPEVITPENQVLIDELITAYSSAFQTNPNLQDPTSTTAFINLAEASVRRLVKMAKHVDSFKKLEQNDQIALLKGAIVEILIMRSSKYFDPNSGSWSVPVANPNSNPRMRLAPEFLQNHSEESKHLFWQYAAFATSLQRLTQGDHTTLLLLLAMSIFSPDRCNLVRRDIVCEFQEKYAACLNSYVKHRFPETPQLFPRLLQKLADIRELNETHCRVLQIVNAEELEPLLIEIFDLSS